MSYSNSVREYWWSFRDLLTMHASPSQLIQYVRPLVDASVFDFDEELGYRLRLGIDETEKASDWLSRMLDDGNCALQEADIRNATLIGEFTRTNISKFERYRRLAIFPKLLQFCTWRTVSGSPIPRRLQGGIWARNADAYSPPYNGRRLRKCLACHAMVETRPRFLLICRICGINS